MAAEPKTRPTQVSVEAFLDRAAKDERRKDCDTLLRMMKKATGAQPRMWGPSLVGFGSYRYKYPSGREGEWPITGFSPRKTDMTLYIMPGFTNYGELMGRLGRHKTGKSCLYIKRLADVDLEVLEELVTASVKAVKKAHG